MNTVDNNVAFRLPDDHVRELNRLSAQSGKSKGMIAKDIVMSALANFSRFDELSHRLSALERMVQHIAETMAVDQSALAEVAGAVNEVRASLATAAFRGLVEFGHVSSDDAAEWVKETFSVREDTP